jgi:hypothetical protein
MTKTPRELGKGPRNFHVLDHGRFASFDDESSTGDIHLLLHKFQLLTSGFEKDIWVTGELAMSQMRVVSGGDIILVENRKTG